MENVALNERIEMINDRRIKAVDSASYLYVLEFISESTYKDITARAHAYYDKQIEASKRLALHP